MPDASTDKMQSRLARGAAPVLIVSVLLLHACGSSDDPGTLTFDVNQDVSEQTISGDPGLAGQHPLVRAHALDAVLDARLMRAEREADRLLELALRTAGARGGAEGEWGSDGAAEQQKGLATMHERTCSQCVDVAIYPRWPS